MVAGTRFFYAFLVVFDGVPIIFFSLGFFVLFAEYAGFDEIVARGEEGEN